MRITNTENHFGIIAILFHWLMAILVIGMLILGLYMADLPVGLEKLKLFGIHKEFGILILMLVIVRSMWRVSNITPYLTMPKWEVIAARTVHWAFYIFMFAMPISGWLISSYAGVPVSFFGLFVLPPLVSPDKNLMRLFQDIHGWLAYGLMLTIILHVLAALKHHFVNKDDILKRMLS
jgi:cytochrome b561